MKRNHVNRSFTKAESELCRAAILQESRDTIYKLTPSGLRAAKILLRKERGEMLMPYEENVLQLLEKGGAS